MALFGAVASLTRFSTVYRLWQAPFASSKLAPLLRRGELGSARRVLDVGCGPGTNAPLFADADYVGVDISAPYINAARSRCRGRFIAADVRTYDGLRGERFDFILVNSLFHHLDAPDVLRVLRRLRNHLTPDGRIHILDLVLPARRGVSRLLARADRGDFPRPLDVWTRLFREVYDEAASEPYSVRRCGIDLWEMIYFQGKVRP